MESHPRPYGDWRFLYELLADLTGSDSVEQGIDTLMASIESIVPADRGVSLMRMNGLIP
ncbi:MAG: hypothetical protein ACOCW3_04990 [Spirochaetota bacterium]